MTNNSAPDLVAVVEEAAAHTRRLLLDLGTPRWSSIASVAALREVLTYFGVGGHPVPTEPVVLNAAAWTEWKACTPVADWPEGAHLYRLTFDHDHQEAGFANHLVYYLPRLRLLVDPAADRFDQPDHGMNVPGPLLTPALAPPLVVTAPVAHPLPGGAVVVYQGYQGGPDMWTRHPDLRPNATVRRAVIGATIRHLKTLARA